MIGTDRLCSARRCGRLASWAIAPGRDAMLKTLCVVAASLLAGFAHAQTTAFTYQGRLDSAGSPANGSYDFEFRIFDDATVGVPDTQYGPTLGTTAAVVNGLVQVPLDFGLGPVADGS